MKILLVVLTFIFLGFVFYCLTRNDEILARHPVYISNLSPLEFLKKLQDTKGIDPPEVTIMDGHRHDWITEKDVVKLATKLDSKTPCLNLNTVISSKSFKSLSTEGDQAFYMISCFDEKEYPCTASSDISWDVKNMQAFLDKRGIKYPDPKTWTTKTGNPDTTPQWEEFKARKSKRRALGRYAQ